MLKAHHHNKLGRIVARFTPEGDAWDGDRWRSAVANSEDALTSSVFARLSYLEPTVLWALLHDSVERLSDQDLPTAPMNPEWLFWPSWRLEPATQTERRVEPDVVLMDRTARHVVVFEAKLHGWQEAEQWVGEIRATHEELHGWSVTFIAVGGLAPEQHHALAAITTARLGHSGSPGATLFSLRWPSLLAAIDRRRELRGVHAGERHLLTDVADVLRACARTPTWFESLQPSRVNESALNDWRPVGRTVAREGMAGLVAMSLKTRAEDMATWRIR